MVDRMSTDTFPRELNAARVKATSEAAKALWQLNPMPPLTSSSAASCNRLAKVAVDAAWEILAQPWSDRLRASDRCRSVAGDLWNLAHEVLGALGAYDEQAQNWRVDRITDEDNRLLAGRLIQAIEDYEALGERERAAKAGRP
jgi:hypothetical protein